MKRRRTMADGGGMKVAAPDEMLDFFSVPPVNSPDVEFIKDYTYYPSTPITSTHSVIEIDIPPTAFDHIILRSVRIRIKAKILAANKANMAVKDEEKMTVAEMGVYQLFSDQKVMLNGTVIDNSNHLLLHQNKYYLMMNKYKHNYENELLYGGVLVDQAGAQDKTKPADNKGNVKRKSQIETSSTFTWLGRYRSPLFDVDKLLPTRTSLKFILTKSNLNHILTIPVAADNTFTFELLDVNILIQKARLTTDAAMAMEQMHRSRPASYNFQTISSSFFSISAGTTTTALDRIYRGRKPINSALLLIDHDRFNGIITKSSLKYDRHNVRHIYLQFDDEVDNKPGYTLDGNDVTQVIESIYKGLGLLEPDNTRVLMFDSENYLDRFPVFYFDHTASLREARSDAVHELKDGNLRFKIDFSKEVNEGENTPKNGIIAILHLIFESNIKLDHEGTVLMNY